MKSRSYPLAFAVILASTAAPTTDGFVLPTNPTSASPLAKTTEDPHVACGPATSPLSLSSQIVEDFAVAASPSCQTSPSQAIASTSVLDRPRSGVSAGSERTLGGLAARLATAQEEGFGVHHRDEFTPPQIAFRSLAGLTALAYAFVPEAKPVLDGGVESIYGTLMSWDMARAPLFEAGVASTGFIGSIIFFSSLHLLLGERGTAESRFDGRAPTMPFEWAEPSNWKLWFNPLASYMGSIWVYHSLVHAKPPPPELAPTFGVLCGELAFGVFLYDLLFYPIHYLYHNSGWGDMRRMHGYHHRVSSHALNSLETVQHSYIDGFLQVAVNIVVQQISPFGGFGHKHFLSRVLHNIVVTYLLAEAHSGYDLPWMSHRILPEAFGGAPRHERHHHDGRVYYHQYFKYFDDLFSFNDWGLERAKEERKPKKREMGNLSDETDCLKILEPKQV